MSVESCVKNGSAGFRWGPDGAIFIGHDAYARAEAVGRALATQKAELAAGTLGQDEWSQGEIERKIAKAGPEDLLTIYSWAPAQGSAVPLSSGVRELRPTVRKGQETSVQVEIKKFAEAGELHCVWAEVYIPGIPDSHGAIMSVDEVRKMAHGFLEKQRTQSVDVNHDNDTGRQLSIVESFIAPANHPDGYIEGSWVVCAHVEDPVIWQKIKDGELNGFSMEALVFKQERVVEFEIPAGGLMGTTNVAPDRDGSLHAHGFTVRLATDGEFLGGETSVDNGHWHEITVASVTGSAISMGDAPSPGKHRHKYSFTDMISPAEV